MKKVTGVAILLVSIMAITGLIDHRFLSAYNIGNIVRWTGLFAVLSLGQLFVIITGGIDLSVGSIVGLVGVLLPMLVATMGVSIPLALLICVLLSIGIGLFHGLLVAKLGIQAFVVTFCGLFVYRGMARFLTGDLTQGFGQGFMGLRFLARGKLPLAFWSDPAAAPQFFQNWSVPMPFVIMAILAILLWVLLERTIYGRYLAALGRNEAAARFSGVHVDRMKILAYVLSALCAGIAAMLFVLDFNDAQPSSQGIFYELYAIAGCVLGGASLRGGEGNILGVILGVAIVRVLYNVINILGIPTQLEYAIVGIVILAGVSVDQAVKMYGAWRRARIQASQS